MKIKDEFFDAWQGMEPLQRYSLLAIGGLGALLLLLMLGFGVRDLVVR